jgi:hypothetical protein
MLSINKWAATRNQYGTFARENPDALPYSHLRLSIFDACQLLYAVFEPVPINSGRDVVLKVPISAGRVEAQCQKVRAGVVSWAIKADKNVRAPLPVLKLFAGLTNGSISIVFPPD